jgi:hypothetical protein
MIMDGILSSKTALVIQGKRDSRRAGCACFPLKLAVAESCKATDEFIADSLYPEKGEAANRCL